MGALSLLLSVDARKAIKGVDDFSDALEDVTDDMQDIAKSGDKAEKSLADNFRDIARKSKEAGKDAGDGIEKGLKKGTKEGFSTAKDEAGSSGKEAAASFSGGFDDVADFLQETLANALTGFGPIGAAAGVALASVLGTALAAAQEAQEKLGEARERAAELAGVLYENKGKLPIEDAVQNLLDLLPQERKAGRAFEGMLDAFVDLGTNIDAVRTAAKLAKAPVDDFVKGLSGADLKATDDALRSVEDALDALQEKASRELNWDNGAAKAQLEALKSELTNVKDSAALADEVLGHVGSAGLAGSAAYVEQVDAIGQAWQDAMVDASDYVNEADGVTTFDWSAYLTDAESTLAAANEYKRQILTVPSDIKAEAESIFSSQGAKAASSYLSSYQTASSGDRARFAAAARQNGEAAGKAQGEAMVKEADAAAKSKASGLTPTQLPVTPGHMDWSRITRNPPTVYIPGVIVKPGTRQPL